MTRVLTAPAGEAGAMNGFHSGKEGMQDPSMANVSARIYKRHDTVLAAYFAEFHWKLDVK